MRHERLLKTAIAGASSPNKNEREAAVSVIKNEIASYRLDPTSVFAAWVESCSEFWPETYYCSKQPSSPHFPKGISSVIEYNLYILDHLTNYDRSYPNKLHSNFGIACFGRYHPDMLIDQLHANDDIRSPYCIAALVQNDWTGTAYFNGFTLEKLSKDLGKIPKRTRLRIFEPSSLSHFLDQLDSANKKYNPSGRNQALGGFLSTHGGDSLMFRDNFSYTGPGDYDVLDDNNFPTVTPKLKKFFAQGASVILQACFVGKENGMAQKLSTLGLEVFGTQNMAGVKSIQVKLDRKGRPHLFPEYNQAPKSRYFRGELISGDDPNATL